MTEDSLRYPIGHFKKPDVITKDIISEWTADIAAFPGRLTKQVEHLTEQQLDTPYRKEGWTIRQVIHHCADSHMNSLMRFKLTLTEDRPVIKPYFENRWAELADSKMPVTPALKMLEGIHERWIVLLKSFTGDDYGKTFIHPEHGKEVRIDENIGIYAWHCNHHLAHIIRLKKIMEWI